MLEVVIGFDRSSALCKFFTFRNYQFFICVRIIRFYLKVRTDLHSSVLDLFSFCLVVKVLVCIGDIVHDLVLLFVLKGF